MLINNIMFYVPFFVTKYNYSYRWSHNNEYISEEFQFKLFKISNSPILEY